MDQTRPPVNYHSMSSQMIGPARVQTLLRRFEKTFKPYRVELTACYGLETALSIGSYTRKEYADLLPQRSADQVRGHPEGWKIDYRVGDGDSCDWCFECRECGVIKYFHRHGTDELARYCNYVDFIQSRVFGLGMQNPENIGQGDCVCRECFRQGRETPVSENLKSITLATTGTHSES